MSNKFHLLLRRAARRRASSTYFDTDVIYLRFGLPDLDDEAGPYAKLGAGLGKGSVRREQQTALYCSYGCVESVKCCESESKSREPLSGFSKLLLVERQPGVDPVLQVILEKRVDSMAVGRAHFARTYFPGEGRYQLYFHKPTDRQTALSPQNSVSFGAQRLGAVVGH